MNRRKNKYDNPVTRPVYAHQVGNLIVRCICGKHDPCEPLTPEQRAQMDKELADILAKAA